MKKEEQILTNDVLPLLREKAELIADLITAKERDLKKAPAGRLRISKDVSREQWFHVSDGTTHCGKFIPQSNMRIAKNLAQKGYDKKILPELKKMQASINRLVTDSSFNRIENAYGKMHPCRKMLVTPLCLPDAEFVDKWLAESYEGKAFDEDVPEILTARGERVRSKSEAIIADTLSRLSIPYKYECPLQLNEMRAKGAKRSFKIFPDFTCLNVRLRREYVWEHFGLMGDADYSLQVVWKMACYEANGFFPGKKLIVSMESGDVPLDAKKVERLARCYLL